MIEYPKAVTNTRADQLRHEWRLIRRSWLCKLARTPNEENRFPVISDDERRFVQFVRLSR